jgi:hypothetical protein
MDKFYNEEGKVAVLYSPGYGAGWSTWAHDENVRVLSAFDVEVVKWIMAGKPKNHFTQEYFEEKYGGYVFVGDMDQLEIEWIEPGTKFRIREYDGFESIETLDEVKWTQA